MFTASSFGYVKRNRWTQEEKEVIWREFAVCIEMKKLPSLKTIQEVKKANKSLSMRTSPQIKTFIHNQFHMKKKLFS